MLNGEKKRKKKNRYFVSMIFTIGGESSYAQREQEESRW
jgi:hypothetical protein